MDGLFNPTNFDFFARFFLAGFIIATVRARYVTGEKPSPADTLYEAVILSLLNQLVFQALASLATGSSRSCSPGNKIGSPQRSSIFRRRSRRCCSQHRWV